MSSNVRLMKARSVVAPMDSFDAANLELTCASSLLISLQCLLEDGGSKVSDTVMMESINGARMILEKIEHRMNTWEVA